MAGQALVILCHSGFLKQSWWLLGCFNDPSTDTRAVLFPHRAAVTGLSVLQITPVSLAVFHVYQLSALRGVVEGGGSGGGS